MDKPKEKQKVVKEENCSRKKLKMRTASDVISRLLWDETLQKDFFVVGYLDRFIGLVEKPFVTLDWRDPAIVDNYTLALPKHRIQYFKYKNKKVWDKMTRLDIVFGSTGMDIDIYNFMKEVDEQENNFLDECCFSRDFEEDGEMNPIPKSYDDSDRPNYFIAARIINEDTVNKLNQVAENIKDKDPVLSQCCITKCEYHITLSILKLDSIEQILDVSEILKSLESLKLEEPKIELNKLGVFKHRVLHACVETNKEFDKLRENLTKLLRQKNINITDRFAYVPHVTILKLSRTVQRLKHSNFLDPSLYIAFEEDNFGSQSVDKLYLCEMKDGRRNDGFYMCAAEVEII